MWFEKKNNIDYENLISVLENGNVLELQKLLWQPKFGKIDYLPITTELIQKLKFSDPSSKHISIFKKIEKGKFELLIFNYTTHNNGFPFYPLIIDKSSGKIVGIMLLFNELRDHFSDSENSVIGDLGSKWVLFTLDQKVK